MTIKGGPYPKDYFRSPIGIPILLAGSFQELRSGHFHSGLDIKTNGRQGYRVYAAADGQIVRVNVSPSGFGNALYVRHPNGFTTVYAHLRNFSSEIEAYVRNEEYARKSFAVDLFPEAGRFPVKKGEVIAISGNTGSTGGPHLHFEIRDSATEWPINPLLFGIRVADTQSPQIRHIKVYALDDRSRAEIRFTNGKTTTVTRGDPGIILVSGGGGRYSPSGLAGIKASGNIAFGIEARDTHDGSGSRLGPYTVTLSKDGKPIFEYQAEKFSFSATRYINAHVDYAERVRNNRWVQRSYLLPGNKLPSYPIAKNSGIVQMKPGTTTEFSYEVADVAGNKATMSFSVTGVAVNPVVEASASEPARHVVSGQPFALEVDGVKADFDANAFYDDFDFEYDSGPGDAESFSSRYSLHDPYTPVHSRFDLSIRASVPTAYKKVVVLGYVNEDGKTSYVPAKYREGWVSASVRSLGTYYVSADSVDPRIRPINIRDGQNMRRSSNIRFRISDAETGVRSYDGYVDGKWVLFSLDAKTGMMIYEFDDHVRPGKHELQVRVTDGVGNVATYEASFSR